VSDPSGAVVAGASLRLRDQRSGSQHDTVANVPFEMPKPGMILMNSAALLPNLNLGLNGTTGLINTPLFGTVTTKQGHRIVLLAATFSF
jgi:hypothetical protein